MQKKKKTVNITKENIPYKDKEMEKLPTKNLLLNNSEGLLMPPEGKTSTGKPAQWWDEDPSHPYIYQTKL